ncbi:MAG: GDSL-type esterase/lipase family protein [Pseudomonadota bacterium]
MPSHRTETPSRWRRMGKTLGINLIVFLVLLIVVELVLGSWLFGPEFGSLNVGINANRVETESPYYPAGTALIYQRDEYGLRGDHGDPSAITILAVGGSTTNDRVATEGDTWPDVLEEELRARGYDHVVANAGVDGHSSMGHIKSFELWFPNIPDLAPEYALIYVGHNDRGVAPGQVPQPDSLTSPSWSRRLSTYIRNHSVFSRAFKNLKGWIAAHDIDVVYGDVDTNPETISYQPVAPVTPNQEALDAYGERLRLLDQVARNYGTTPIYVTQPVGLVREAGGELEEVAGSGAGSIFQEMRAYNDVLLAFCRDVGAICIDLAGELVFDTQDFYDAIHTTPSGSRRIGTYLAEQLPAHIE